MVSRGELFGWYLEMDLSISSQIWVLILFDPMTDSVILLAPGL